MYKSLTSRIKLRLMISSVPLILLIKSKTSNFRYGSNCYIANSARVRLMDGSIKIGSNVQIGDNTILETFGGSIEIGDNVSIGHNCVIYGHGGVTIKDNVLIANNVTIIPANHKFKDKNRLIRSQGISKNGIIIEENCWLGAHVVVCDGVIIGRGSVVGAAAVLRASIDAGTVYK